MNWPDFTKRSNAIAILLAMQLGYFIATFASWFFVKHYGGDTDFRASTASSPKLTKKGLNGL